MAVPKRRMSRSNTRSRRAQWKAAAPTLVNCENRACRARKSTACSRTPGRYEVSRSQTSRRARAVPVYAALRSLGRTDDDIAARNQRDMWRYERDERSNKTVTHRVEIHPHVKCHVAPPPGRTLLYLYHMGEGECPCRSY